MSVALSREELKNLTNQTEANQLNSPIKQHQKSRSSPKLMNSNIQSLITKSNKYLTETTAMLQKTKTLLITPSNHLNSTTNLIAGGQNFEIVESLTSKNGLSISPQQYSFLNNIAPSFVSSMPTSNNPSFSNSSLSKFRNFAFILSLNEKGLTKLSGDMIINKTNLQILELKNNKFKNVPEEIFQLVNLKCLKLDCNYIKEIPVELCESLKQLEIVSFYDNILNKVPAEIMKWKQTLIYLNIAENHIDTLPNEIGELSKLSSLHLQHNHFCFLPKMITNLTNLKEIGLDWFKYSLPTLKVIQQWKSCSDETATRFFSLKKLQEDSISFEKFVIQLSFKTMDFKTILPKERSFIHRAAIENDIGALRALLNIQTDLMNKVDSEAQTPLFLSICNENYLASKVLLHNGADPRIGGGVLGSCLNLATAKCQFYLVSDLLKYGAEVDRCDVDGNNALHVLMCLFDSDPVNYRKIGELLLSYGLNPNSFNKHKWAAIHLAIKRGQSGAVKWVLEYNEAHILELRGNDLVEFNSEGGVSRSEIFNLNSRGGEERLTPLQLAIIQNNISMVENLVLKGKVDLFVKSRSEKIASHYGIQNIFLYKILKTHEKNQIQKEFLESLIKEKKLLALGKHINVKSEAEISDDSSETKTFQKVKDLNEVTKDKRVFCQRGHTLSSNPISCSKEQRSLYFNKFNPENNNFAMKKFLKPPNQPTLESLNETNISDIEENKSDLDIIFELDGQWGKNMRTFFGSPNNIRQIDALQKVNTLLNKIRPQKNPKVQSIYSKKIASNHLKVISDSLNELVENLKKSMKVNQIRVLDTGSPLFQRIKQLNSVLNYQYKLLSLLSTFHEEKALVEQFKRLIESNPKLASLRNGERPIFEATQQASVFFNQTHSTLVLRWLIYLMMNTFSNSHTDNPIFKYYLIKILAGFNYENAASFLQGVHSDFQEPFLVRYEALQALNSMGQTEILAKMATKPIVAEIKNNSSLRPVSLEISREINTDKLKNFGSNYFSNKKQAMKNENRLFARNEIKSEKSEKNSIPRIGSSSMISQNLITVNSSEMDDYPKDNNLNNGETLYEEMKREQQKMRFSPIIEQDEKYTIEGFKEKDMKVKVFKSTNSSSSFTPMGNDNKGKPKQSVSLPYLSSSPNKSIKSDPPHPFKSEESFSALNKEGSLELILFGCDSANQPRIFGFDVDSESFVSIKPPNNFPIYNYSQAVGISQNLIVITGGTNKEKNIISQDAVLYNVFSNTAVVLPQMSQGRFSHISIFHKERAYVFGGRSKPGDGNIMNHCEFLTLTNENCFGTHWTRMPDSLLRRCTGFSMVYEDNIYLVGGYTGQRKRSKKIERFSLISNVWEIINLRLLYGAERGLLLPGNNPNEFMIFGGKIRSGDSNMVYVYNLKRQTYTYCREMLSERVLQKGYESHKKGCIYMIGGDPSNTIEKVKRNQDYLNWQWTKLPPNFSIKEQIKQYSHSQITPELISGVEVENFKESFTAGEKKYVLFGTDCEPNILVLDVGKAEVRAKPVPNPLKLYGYQGVVRLGPGRYFLCGGLFYSRKKISRDAFIYDAEAHSVQKCQKMIGMRYTMNILIKDQRIYVIGGRSYGNDHEGILNTCECFDLALGEWKVIAPLNKKRCTAMSFLIDNVIYIAGGYNGNVVRETSFETYSESNDAWYFLGVELSEPLEASLVLSFENKLLFLGGRNKSGDTDFSLLYDFCYGIDTMHLESSQRLLSKKCLHKGILFDKTLMLLGGENFEFEKYVEFVGLEKDNMTGGLEVKTGLSSMSVANDLRTFGLKVAEKMRKIVKDPKMQKYGFA